MVLHAVESLCLSKKQAKEITGGLSVPSRMPGKAYSIPAKRCITGAKMRDIPGSICSGCYALKGRYGFQNVQDAQERRFQSLNDPRWIDAMVVLVRGESWFRWHDSGDLQSVAHFGRIIEVCKRTPTLNNPRTPFFSASFLYWRHPIKPALRLATNVTVHGFHMKVSEFFRGQPRT